jgi:hypothetical protein
MGIDSPRQEDETSTPVEIPKSKTPEAVKRIRTKSKSGQLISGSEIRDAAKLAETRENLGTLDSTPGTESEVSAVVAEATPIIPTNEAVREGEEKLSTDEELAGLEVRKQMSPGRQVLEEAIVVITKQIADGERKLEDLQSKRDKIELSIKGKNLRGDSEEYGVYRKKANQALYNWQNADNKLQLETNQILKVLEELRDEPTPLNSPVEVENVIMRKMLQEVRTKREKNQELDVPNRGSAIKRYSVLEQALNLYGESKDIHEVGEFLSGIRDELDRSIDEPTIAFLSDKSSDQNSEEYKNVEREAEDTMSMIRGINRIIEDEKPTSITNAMDRLRNTIESSTEYNDRQKRRGADTSGTDWTIKLNTRLYNLLGEKSGEKFDPIS